VFTRSLFSGALAALSLCFLAGCEGGGGTDVGNPITVNVDGRLERGSVVTVTATASGAVIAPGTVQLTVSPADGAEVLGGGQVRLLRAGTLTITATAPQRVGTRQVTVAAPPVVVFDRMEAGNRDIWRVDLDGQNLVRLTTNAGDDQDPTVAQRRVVFTSYRHGNAELFSIALAGGAETRLTTTAGGETAPALSADGERLAYSYAAGGDLGKVWIANGSGGGAARATSSFGFSGSLETAPAWAPTGNRLMMVATALGTADLFTVQPPAQPTLAAGGDAPEVEPAWSPDGTTVVFTSNRATGGSGPTDLYLLRVSDGAVTRLTQTAVTEIQPAWTPDGRVVYTESVGGVLRLRWLDPAAPATSFAIETGPGSAQRPAVSVPLD
jgi:Tol biopolymer transport system component